MWIWSLCCFTRWSFTLSHRRCWTAPSLNTQIYFLLVGEPWTPWFSHDLPDINHASAFPICWIIEFLPHSAKLISIHRPSTYSFQLFFCLFPISLPADLWLKTMSTLLLAPSLLLITCYQTRLINHDPSCSKHDRKLSGILCKNNISVLALDTDKHPIRTSKFRITLVYSLCAAE